MTDRRPRPGGDGDHPLTPRRQKILDFIGESMERRRYSPSMREIADAAGLKSVSTVSYHFKVLEQTGHLTRDAGIPRTVVEKSTGTEAVQPIRPELPGTDYPRVQPTAWPDQDQDQDQDQATLDAPQNTPGPVLMPWLDKVSAVLQVWYPGEQFGTALARVLFGDDDPGGRLPVTFPAHAGQGPVQTAGQYPGIGGVATYTEDILVGYRFFAANNQQPLFPFGHGLSFARFGYENLQVARPGTGEIRLSFGIVNDSPRPGL